MNDKQFELKFYVSQSHAGLETQASEKLIKKKKTCVLFSGVLCKKRWNALRKIKIKTNPSPQKRKKRKENLYGVLSADLVVWESVI